MLACSSTTCFTGGAAMRRWNPTPGPPVTLSDTYMESEVNERLCEHPTRKESFLVWLKVGLLSFGGPAAQIALMHKMVVADKRWLSEKQYLNALNFCMLLPGPEAMQLATYSGWRLHGVIGGLIAGLLFVLPGALVMAALALLYSVHGDVPLVDSLFLGIKAAVIVIVIEALLRVSNKALTSATQWGIAGLAFVGIFFLNLPYPLIVLVAALFGLFKHARVNDASRVTAPTSAMLASTARTVFIWVLIWASPIVLLALFTDHSLLVQVGTFFSRLAVVTFGGAYAVLAYLGQEVVANYGWLSAGEMMDGLGLAETTPGPLILVTEFVGFIAGFRDGGIGMGIAAALVTLWVTFVPCFLWIFAGAPYLDWISDQPRLRGALSAITAAVVGVILNLSLWFALHVLFKDVNRVDSGAFHFWVPALGSIDWIVATLTVLCGIAALKYHWGIVKILMISALLGALLSLATTA